MKTFGHLILSAVLLGVGSVMVIQNGRDILNDLNELGL